MTNDLRAALRDLAPEPPAALGRPETAWRRAKALRCRRYATVSSAATLAVVAAFGITLTVPGGNGADSAGSRQIGTFPNWPRRGDVTDAVVSDAALGAWRAYFGRHDPTPSQPQVLYGGGGAQPVFVLHAASRRGGERLAVLTRDAAGRWNVVSDTPAPLRDAVVTVQLEPPGAAEHPVGAACAPAAASHASRLLVLGPPDTRSARWRQNRVVPPGCADRSGSDTPWTDVPLTDGAGLVPASVTPYGGTEVEVVTGDRVVSGAPERPRRDTASYGGLAVSQTWAPVRDGWAYRTDRTRAELLAERMPNAAGDRGECRRIAAFNLPDSTPVAVCAAAGDGYDVVTWAEGADRVVRAYRVRTKMLNEIALVVHGHTGRWLVVVGPPGLTGVAFVDSGERHPVPTTHGIGWWHLDLGPYPGARVTTADFPPGGGIGVEQPAGVEVRW